MLRILLIGAGELGSRHLQALALLQERAEIVVVEPSPQSAARAKTRFSEAVKANTHTQHSLAVLPNLDHLRGSFDFLINATNADVRATVIEQALSAVQLRYAILEKVLVQRSSELGHLQRLLKISGTTAWVNCSKRFMPFFQFSREMLAGHSCTLGIAGHQWGLACNAIHHLDILSFITGHETGLVIDDLLDRETIPAKRSGFLEFTGTLHARDDRGSSLTQSSWRQGTAPFSVHIESAVFTARYDVASQVAEIAGDFSSWKSERRTFAIPLQSALTNVAIEEICRTGKSTLPSFVISAGQHRIMLQTFLSHFKTHNGWDQDFVPIT
jgi:hypothetical protein